MKIQENIFENSESLERVAITIVWKSALNLLPNSLLLWYGYFTMVRPDTIVIKVKQSHASPYLIIFTNYLFFFQTNIGTVLLSINPHKKLPLYTPDAIDIYRCHCLYELPPHM